MGENTLIEWAHSTFNAWVGCQKISPACDNCYAENWAKRTGQAGLWQGERRRTHEVNWRQPIKWNKAAEAAGVRHRVFCSSLADVFDNQVPKEWRRDLFGLIRETPSLDWLLLTKRPQNIRKMLPHDWFDGWKNVWLGTTVENRIEADRRIPHLLAVPARVRFLSCEPLLKPIHFSDVTRRSDAVQMLGKPALQGIQWVICGGESGPGARPMHPDWARSLRDQCAAAGVAFFMKQMGGKRKPFAPIPDDLMVREFPADGCPK